MAIDWTRGYSAEWRVHRVNEATWADAERLEGVDEVDVDLVATGQLAGGGMTVTAPLGTEFEPGYYRVGMVARQDGASERVDLATLLFESAEWEDARGVRTFECEGRSVLHPAAKLRELPYPYAPAGTDGAEMAAALLRANMAAPVVVEGSFALGADVAFAPGKDALTCAWLMLDAGGFMMFLDGDGTVRIAPRPTEPALDLAQVGARLIMPGTSHELDMTEIPNRYTAVMGDQRAQAVNEDESSPTSRQARGYWHDVYDSAPKPLDGETLERYCERKLREASTVSGAGASYEREWWPGAVPGCIVRGGLASTGIEGDLRIVSQALTCANGVTVAEKACREVVTWRG